MFPQIKHCLAIRDTSKALTSITVYYGITKDVKVSKSVINYPRTHTHRNLESFHGKPIQRKLLV